MIKRVLVTGANGQLGKTIKELYLINKDNIVFVFAEKSELDITKKHKFTDFFKTNKFDYCINCAAYTNVEQAEENPDIAYKVNAYGVRNLAEACKENNIILIHLSTDYVFDGEKLEPYTEKDITNPINEYGKSKLQGENYIQNTHKNYFIIRTSWLYSNYGNNFLKVIVSKIKENKKLSIITSQKGTPVSCFDLAEFIYYLINTKNNEYGIYHYSAKGVISWYDFAKEISTHYPNYTKLSPVKNFFTKAKRPLYSVLNNSKVKAIFNKEVFWKNSVGCVINLLK